MGKPKGVANWWNLRHRVVSPAEAALIRAIAAKFPELTGRQLGRLVHRKATTVLRVLRDPEYPRPLGRPKTNRQIWLKAPTRCPGCGMLIRWRRCRVCAAEEAFRASRVTRSSA